MDYKIMHNNVNIEHYLSILGGFYKDSGRLWRVSDCEELVGEVNHTTECMTDLFSFVDFEWIILFFSSNHFDFNYH